MYTLFFGQLYPVYCILYSVFKQYTKLSTCQVSDKLTGVVETRPGTKVARPEDLVRLYDIILQNCADMKSVQSLDKDGEIYKMIDVYTLFYRTKRLGFPPPPRNSDIIAARGSISA